MAPQRGVSGSYRNCAGSEGNAPSSLGRSGIFIADVGALHTANSVDSGSARRVQGGVPTGRHAALARRSWQRGGAELATPMAEPVAAPAAAAAPPEAAAPAAMHVKARAAHPAYPARSEGYAPSWGEPAAGYSPTVFTHDAVLQNDDLFGFHTVCALLQRLVHQLEDIDSMIYSGAPKRRDVA